MSAEEQILSRLKPKYVTTSIPILAVRAEKKTIWDMQGEHLGDKRNLFQ